MQVEASRGFTSTIGACVGSSRFTLADTMAKTVQYGPAVMILIQSMFPWSPSPSDWCFQGQTVPPVQLNTASDALATAFLSTTSPECANLGSDWMPPMRVRKKRSVKGGMLGALSFNVWIEVDGIFDEGIAKISVRNAMAAYLIFSAVSLDSFSKANASACRRHRGRKDNISRFICLFVYDYVFKVIRHETLYRVLLMSSWVPPRARNSSLYKLKIAVASMGFFFLMSSLSRKFNNVWKALCFFLLDVCSSSSSSSSCLT